MRDELRLISRVVEERRGQRSNVIVYNRSGIRFPQGRTKRVLVYDVEFGVDKDTVRVSEKDIGGNLRKDVEYMRKVIEKELPSVTRNFISDIQVYPGGRRGGYCKEGHVSVRRDGDDFVVEIGADDSKYALRLERDDLEIVYVFAVDATTSQEFFDGNCGARVWVEGNIRKNSLRNYFVEEGGDEFRQKVGEEFRRRLKRHLSVVLYGAMSSDVGCRCNYRDAGKFFNCCCKTDGGEVCFTYPLEFL